MSEPKNNLAPNYDVIPPSLGGIPRKPGVTVSRTPNAPKPRDLLHSGFFHQMQQDLAQSTVAPSSPLNFVNSLMGNPSGTNEAAKAYMHQFGLSETDYTEKNLSPAGLETLRRIAADQFGGKNQTRDGFEDSSNFYEGMAHSREPGYLGHFLGRVAPENIRQVVIDGVPYWQVLDQYDFNGQKEEVVEKGPVNMLREAAEGLSQGRWYVPAKQIPSALGLQFNSNLLVPVQPGKEARPESVEAFRQKNRLPFPNKTLGGKVMNSLAPMATEKVMP